MRTRHLSGLLIAAILVISTAPLYAQRQQQNVAKLKADARNLVGIIGSDKTKTQTYCQIEDLSEQLDQAVEKNDIKKAKALAEKTAELTEKMGPEFVAFVDIETDVVDRFEHCAVGAQLRSREPGRLYQATQAYWRYFLFGLFVPYIFRRSDLGCSEAVF